MTFHIVLSGPRNLQAAAEAAAAGNGPRQSMWDAATQLAATIHEPAAGDPDAIADRFSAMLVPPRKLWSLARHVADVTRPGDVVFCPSEAAGLQMAAVLAGRRPRPTLAVFVHNVDRPRARLAMKLWSMEKHIDLFLACSETQVEALQHHFPGAKDRIRFMWDHTDTKFFCPGEPDAVPARPRIVSVGLENRDYRTVAAATSELDVDVCISGFSKDAAALGRTFPDVLPENMSRRFYSWLELRDLYRSAAAVVVSCFENRYAAGVQSLMEGSACGRAVIATATEGLRAYTNPPVVAIPPGDVGAMRSAIARCLEDDRQRVAAGARNRETALRLYDYDRFVAELVERLRSLH